MPAITWIQKPKYPLHVADHIIQYDEHVFVWMDETENAGGVGQTLEEAQRQLKLYSDNL